MTASTNPTISPSAPVAVVTGAAGGIGATISARLVRDGHTVAMLDTAAAVHPTCKEVDGAYSAQLDVTDAVAVRRVLDGIRHDLDGLDVLVNCAGTAHRSSFAATTADEFMADVRSNLLGTFLACQAAVFPHMQHAGQGRLINIASISGKTGGTGPVHPDGAGGRSGPGYASAKAGVINLTRWMAREVGRFGITSNAVAPGPIISPMTHNATYDASDIPLGRLGTTEEVADAVAWLAGDGARYINGTVVDVDGGLTRA
jgi:3-oxoacyl-[acyl-carrier protein] reductase